MNVSCEESRATPGGSRGPDDDPDVPGRATRWLLLEGNRLAVAGGVTAAVLLAFLVVLLWQGAAVVVPNSPVNFLFSALLTGDLTLLTVVLSINQVVLSRELGAPGRFRRRIGEAIDYRREVESAAGADASPNEPSAFLRFLHEELGAEASALDDEAAAIDDDECRARLRALVGSISRDVVRVNGTLDRAGDRVFTVVSATLATNHADQFREIAAVRRRHADALSAEAAAALGTIQDLLVGVDVARQYFKTVFVQKELAYLSRLLLYVGVPAIVGCGLTLALYNAAADGSVSVAVLGVVATGAFAAGFAPLAVLFAFILRLAWIAQRSSTTAPFVAASSYRS